MSITLGDAVRELARDPDMRKFGVVCTVISVDMNEKTIEAKPLDGSARYLSVKLQTNPASGALYIPKVDSFVIVEQTSTSTAYVALWSELEEIVFFDGENKGMVKVSELVEKLNTVENDLNTLKNLFATWITVPNDGGAALKTLATITTTWATDTLTPTQVNDLENDKIKH
jgi:hypothetical protein